METITNLYQPSFGIFDLRRAIQSEYSLVACDPDHKIHFTSGLKLAYKLGYSAKTMAYVPAEAIKTFAGVGNPFAMGGLSHGETILDLGSGGGFDCIYASVLSEGLTEIIGVDMTAAMLAKAKENAEIAGTHNISFIQDYLEEIPLPAESVDLVISNGVINFACKI